MLEPYESRRGGALVRRIIIGSISHETNTFSNVPTKLSDFDLQIDEQILIRHKDTRTICSAFLKVIGEQGFEAIPTVWAGAQPSGLVESSAFNWLLDNLVARVKNAQGIDGVLLHLHGAMAAEDCDDPEGKILETLREVVGESVPIVSTLDMHANITETMVAKANVLIGYDTYPHIDGYERGVEAANVIARILRGEITPSMAMCKLPMITSPQVQKTAYHPMKDIMDLAHKIEEEEGIINVTVAAGYPFADFEFIGMTMVVTTNNDRNLAQKKADELASNLWKKRRAFFSDVVPVKEAVEEAMKAAVGPIVLADLADNPGGGSPCDGTIILRALLEMGAQDALVAVIADPEAVSKAIEAGVGNTVAMKIGGKTDRLHGDPVEVKGTVKLISNGRFVPTGPMSTGLETDLGKTVVLRCGGVDVILTEKRYAPISLTLYRSLGIEPTDKKIIVVKSAVHFRASHEPIAKRIVEVDAPGIHGARLAAFKYKKVRRPIFPLDPEMLGIAELNVSWSD
jgi:microcystin degradation protein MlrC